MNKVVCSLLSMGIVIPVLSGCGQDAKTVPIAGPGKEAESTRPEGAPPAGRTPPPRGPLQRDEAPAGATTQQ